MTHRNQGRETDGKFGRALFGGGGPEYEARNGPPAPRALDKAEVRKVVANTLGREGVTDLGFTHNKLGLDIILVDGAVKLDSPDITFCETPNARQGDVRHPADAARLIRAQHKARGGSLEAVADAWYAKNVRPPLLAHIAVVTPSEEDAALIAELNSREGRERIIETAADEGVRLDFGRFNGDDYELFEGAWVEPKATDFDIERAYRAEIKKHLS